ncbi:ATP-binding protein [Actinomadura napierensis]|uniref:Histidine kinase/HSP90-like ATPase domain-containing protein n=1 Tax=Actinomadura napierensis TaxID=267854 RepID=A0ABP5M3I6_9ACTN
MGADGPGIDTATSIDTTTTTGTTTGTGVDATGIGAAAGERDPSRDASGGASRAASWELPDDPRTASRARALTTRTLDAWHVTDPADVDDIVLIVDELVTNAVVHGAGPVRLALRLDGARLTGEVADAVAAAPPAGRPGPAVLDWSEAGRGLLLVTALATGFGARPHAAGKTVWFTRDLNRVNGHHPNGHRPAAAAAAAPVTAERPSGPQAAPPPLR